MDLEFLFLGYQNGGRFDEKDIEGSDIKRLDVGRILDEIASLKEKNLVSQNNDGSFAITDAARHMFWDESVPLWARILRILNIRALSLESISKYLDTKSEKISAELEALRKDGFVLMSPLRKQDRLEKIFEILPDGAQKLQMAQSGKTKEHHAQKEIFEALDEIKELVERDVSDESKEKILEKIRQIRTRLDI